MTIRLEVPGVSMELGAIHLDHQTVAEQKVHATDTANAHLPTRSRMPHPQPEERLDS